MHRNGVSRYGTTKWRCAARNRSRFAERYEADTLYRLSHYWHNQLRLYGRLTDRKRAAVEAI